MPGPRSSCSPLCPPFSALFSSSKWDRGGEGNSPHCCAPFSFQVAQGTASGGQPKGAQRRGKELRAHPLTAGLSSFLELHTQNLRNLWASRLGQSVPMLPGALGTRRALRLRGRVVLNLFLFTHQQGRASPRGAQRGPPRRGSERGGFVCKG